MKISLCSTIKGYKKNYLAKDLIAGIIIATFSIPISIGYAQIAGLPAIYGLYGSVFPIIIFALLSTSPQFIFGVDAAPAAVVGAALISLNIPYGSEEAMKIVPVITLFTAVWLLIFYYLRAGNLVNYISTPVMGGFVSGVCCTIILMQLPKLFGGTVATGDLFDLLPRLLETLGNISIPSFVVGMSTFVIIRLSRKLIPKFPVAVVMMFVGALLTKYFHIDEYGIALLTAVEPGLPMFSLPDISGVDMSVVLRISLPIAVVIMAETLLGENTFALKNDYKLNYNQEILAFAAGNFVASLTGCCPINGSVSRTAVGEGLSAKTQVTSIAAGVSMLFVCVFATDFIGYLPVPVLTAIVLSSLINACEFDFAKKLWKVDKDEFYIFWGAFIGVLLLGTVYGVLFGALLSFASVIRRAAAPKRCYLGVLPGHNEFFDMTQFKHIYPIENVVMYRFSGNLFFANIDMFQDDIQNAITDETKAVIVDAGSIVSIDITAAERLSLIYKKLKDKGIKFYITEHIEDLNEQFRSKGLGWMIEKGSVRRTISIALEDMGIVKPYPLVGSDNKVHSVKRKRAVSSAHEFVWAFGANAEEQIEKQIYKQIEVLKETHDLEDLTHGRWLQMDSFDEDEWLEHLEAHLSEIVKISQEDEITVAKKLEKRRKELLKKIQKEHPELAERFEERRHKLDEHLKDHSPEIYERIIRLREDMKE